MKIRTYNVCLALGVLSCLSLFSHSSDLIHGKFTKTSEICHGSDADYIFLQDDKKQEWIYKQVSDTSPDDQIVIVWESIASEIALALDIPINQAFLVSPHDSFEYRLMPKYPGSLHLKVQGQSAHNSLPWEGFDVHQKIRSPFMIKRLGALPREQIGLRKVIIENIAKHPDLAKLVALDTYLGNNDRSDLNVFYNAKTNEFYGIDMGNCLMGNLPLYAKENLERLFEEKAVFSDEEKKGLALYKKTLQALTLQFPSKKIIEILGLSLEKGGFTKQNSILWNEDVENKINKWKFQIEENYQSTLKLISFLEDQNI